MNKIPRDAQAGAPHGSRDGPSAGTRPTLDATLEKTNRSCGMPAPSAILRRFGSPAAGKRSSQMTALGALARMRSQLANTCGSIL